MTPLLPPTRDDWPLHNAAASRALEAAALARHAPHTLIERAGLAVARLALALWPHAHHVVVLAGPGNNGGDGLIAARLLAARGRSVRVHRLGPPPAVGSDAAHALAAAQAAGLTIIDGPPPPQVADTNANASAGANTNALTSTSTKANTAAPVDLWIDALLGLGSSRAPSGDIAAAIRVANADPAPILSIDLPSGLHPDTGQPLGPDVVVADHTLSLLSLKPGLFTGEGRALSGRIWFDDLGEVTSSAAPTATLAGLDTLTAWRQRHPRTATSHKGRHGDVVVLGGAPGMRGAAWLAATSALTAGAGRVYAALPEDDGQPWPTRPELMHWPQERWERPRAWREAVVVCGCGGGTALNPWLNAVLHEARHLVLDADGLNLVAADAALRQRLATRRAHGLHTVITPHPLEAARLLELPSAAAIQSERLVAAQTLADRFQCAVVLKGSGSIVAAPELTPFINSTGSAALATAGSGDVLAGWIGGLWAQAPQAAAQDVALTATVWHGAAAQDHAGPLRAADLIDAMARLHRAS